LDQFGVTEPAVFCGLSWGSIVSLRVALRHPQRVRGLFLMSTSALASRHRFVPQFVALAAAVGAFGFPDSLIRLMASAMVSPQTLSASPNLVHDMLSRNRHLDRRALCLAALSVLVRRSSFVHELWRIRAPTRIIVGEHDRLTPLRAAQIVANAIDGARLHVLQGVGHLPSLEAPAEVNALLRVALDDMG
jgi:pimeloyl-ACP methyl ester carboxylesterase